MTSHTINIPNWHPTRLNTLMENRWSASRKKKADAQMMAVYAYNAKIPKATGKRIVEILITLTRGRSPDPDAFHKTVLDGLTSTGYLKDDSEKWAHCPPAKFMRGKQKATQIVLTDIA